MADDAIFKYDRDANALYYRLTSEPVVRTVSIGDRVMVDVDADGGPIGIEVLDPPGFSFSVTPGPAGFAAPAADWQHAYAGVIDAIRTGGSSG